MRTSSWDKEEWELEAAAIDLPLAQTFKIARKTWDVAHNVFVTLRFGGVAGVGEANPSDRWDERAEGVVAQLETLQPELLLNPFNLQGPMDLLPPGAARAALDIALHDLAGKIAGLPVCKLLGTKARPVPPTSVTVPIASPEEMSARAKSLSGHPVLKVKVGFDGDIDAVATIRKSYSGRVRIDANEGWDPNTAIARLKELERFDIELCEQPIPAGNLSDLKRITDSTQIPIFADEDACTPADVVALRGKVKGVNLKLRKAGGLRALTQAIAVARAQGMEVMIGCDIESGVAATAAAHAAGLADYADIDSPLLLKEDPFPGVSYDNGRMILPDTPGLGVKGAPQ